MFAWDCALLVLGFAFLMHVSLLVCELPGVWFWCLFCLLFLEVFWVFGGWGVCLLVFIGGMGFLSFYCKVGGVASFCVMLWCGLGVLTALRLKWVGNFGFWIAITFAIHVIGLLGFRVGTAFGFTVLPV